MTKSPQFPRRHTPPAPEAIRALRESVRLSIPAMANMCSVSPKSWAAWENGTIMPAPVWKLANMIVEQIRDKKPP